MRGRSAGGHRTHRQLRNAGLTDNGQMTMLNSIGPCCKLWLPCTETSGTTLTDAVAGAVLTPSSISFVTPNTVRAAAATGVGPYPAVGLTLTSGSFPTIGTKNFILFGVQKLSNDMARANSYLMLNDTAGNYLGVFDGDGAQLTRSGSNTIVSGTDTFAGADGAGNSASNAIIRDGDSLGNWCMPLLVPDPGAQGNTVGTGDVYARVCRNDGFNGAGTPMGRYSRNDYNIPDSTIQSWQTYPDLSGAILSYNGMTFGTSLGGLPGVWSYIDPAFSVGTINRIQIGNGMAGQNDYYGIALFVFDGALPSDFKQALRWMTAQWQAGNKVLWPGWVSVT